MINVHCGFLIPIDLLVQVDLWEEDRTERDRSLWIREPKNATRIESGWNGVFEWWLFIWPNFELDTDTWECTWIEWVLFLVENPTATGDDTVENHNIVTLMRTNEDYWTLSYWETRVRKSVWRINISKLRKIKMIEWASGKAIHRGTTKSSSFELMRKRTGPSEGE